MDDPVVLLEKKLYGHPRVLWKQVIRLLTILLLVLETSQYRSGLGPEEVTLLVRLDGEHPSSGHIISRLELPHVDEIKNLVANPGFVLQMFRFSKLFVVSSYFLMLLFVHEISFWLLFLLPFRK